MIDLTGLTGVVDHDPDRHEGTIRAGTTLERAGAELFERGLAYPNLGDINKQSVVGAAMTGTHGSGSRFQNLASVIVGATLVTSDGSIRTVSASDDPGLLAALRVSLGLLGVVTRIRARLVPAFRLRRREWCANIDDCLAHLAELVERNRNMDFYWYPRNDEVKIRTMNHPDDASFELPYATCVEDETDWSHHIIAQERNQRFEEMEYSLPAEAGTDCLLEVREAMKRTYRRTVGWRVLYRTVAPDDAWLSPQYGRQTVTISLHQNAQLPYQEFFEGIEPIFRRHGGRPHWGKKFTATVADLREMYPKWDAFEDMRRVLDPTGLFLTPDLATLFGVGRRAPA